MMENPPSVSSIKYKVRWDGAASAWVKELFILIIKIYKVLGL